MNTNDNEGTQSNMKDNEERRRSTKAIEGIQRNMKERRVIRRRAKEDN